MNSSAIIIGALGLAVWILMVWLPIRVLNRGWRDRKARLGIALLFALLSYPAMLGPCCWTSSRLNFGGKAVSFVYGPLMRIVRDELCPNAVGEAALWYSELGAKSSWHWGAFLPTINPNIEDAELPELLIISWVYIEGS